MRSSIQMHLVIVMTLLGMLFAPAGINAQPSDRGSGATQVYLPLIFSDEAAVPTEEEVVENFDEAETIDLAGIAPLEEQSIQAAATTTQKLAIPAYFYPEGANLTFWDRLAGSDDRVGIVILNPNDGPGSAPEANYVSQASRLRGRVTLLGYVDTKSGRANKSLSQIQQEINHYYSWYPVDGIYFDNVPATDCTKAPTYRGLYDDVQAKGGAAQVALGFGADFSQCMFDQVGPKVIGVNFNDSYTDYQRWQPEAWTTSYPANRFWHFVSAVTQTNLAQAVNLSKQRNVNWIYITDDKGNNPWDTLPNDSYWQEELRLISGDDSGSTVRVFPIPGNIIRTTDPKYFEIGGYVYVNGAPVAGATVTIRDSRGKTLVARTEAQEEELPPYYLQSLATLGIKKGSTILITATFGGQTTPEIRYKLEPGLQQLDLLLSGSGTFTKPIATVNYRSLFETFYTDENLVLKGSGQDTDSTNQIKAYRWTVNGIAVKGSKPIIKINGEKSTPGSYTITFSVQDNEGEWSAPVLLTYTLEAAE